MNSICNTRSAQWVPTKPPPEETLQESRKLLLLISEPTGRLDPGTQRALGYYWTNKLSSSHWVAVRSQGETEVVIKWASYVRLDKDVGRVYGSNKQQWGSSSSLRLKEQMQVSSCQNQRECVQRNMCREHSDRSPDPGGPTPWRGSGRINIPDHFSLHFWSAAALPLPFRQTIWKPRAIRTHGCSLRKWTPWQKAEWKRAENGYRVIYT